MSSGAPYTGGEARADIRFAPMKRMVGVAGALAWVVLLGTSSPAAKAASGSASGLGAVGAMRTFRRAPGLKVDLFAEDPMVRNIVSFTFDEQGRCYVVESFRRRTSVFDIRNLPEWLDVDFSFRTTGDRAEFFKRTLSSENPGLAALLKAKPRLLSDFNQDGVVNWHDLEVESEQIRLLRDSDGDGRADEAVTFAGGFNGIASGVAAGVLARHGEVWFTSIPGLYHADLPALRTSPALPPEGALPFKPSHPEAAKDMKTLIDGFGVHIAFGGHDLHGLRFGPDERLYFSIADRGTSTNLWDRIIDHWPGLTPEALADSGAVFRCLPDGRELEVVAIGLRNPQELAFDEWGNLFTGDNNGDGGDKARWEHIVEGADYGWRMGWQWLPKMGAWNSEMLWGLQGTNTSAHVLTPVAHIGAGPAGIAYYPGTGLPRRYDRHFLMCDFRGGPNSLVHSFALKQAGASFEAHDLAEFISGFLCTDVEFGPDGGVYVSDWVRGWDKTDQGRIYRITDPDSIQSPEALSTRRLLAEGMAGRSPDDLVLLLAHQDLRVRLEAQRDWKRRVESALLPGAPRRVSNIAGLIGRLVRVAKAERQSGPEAHLSLTSRWHAIEALGAIASLDVRLDTEPALRKRLRSEAGGETESSLGWQILPWSLLQDPVAEIRVATLRCARQCRGEPGDWSRVESLIGAALRDLDPRVRLEATQAAGRWKRTSLFDSVVQLVRETGDRDPHLRHAAVLALARIGDPAKLITLADDPDRSVRLAGCLALRRAGSGLITRFLADRDPQVVLEAARGIYDAPVPEGMHALAALSDSTAKPEAKIADVQATALWRRVLAANFRLGGNARATALAAFATREDSPEELRVEALGHLADWEQPAGRDPIVGLWRPLPSRPRSEAVDAIAGRLTQLTSPTSRAHVRTAALQAATKLGLSQPSNPGLSPGELATRLEKGTIQERQSAFAALAAAGNADAAEVLKPWVQRLSAGQVPRELQLDVALAVQSHPLLKESEPMLSALRSFEALRDGKDPLGGWRECLEGGNADLGRKTFLERQDLACLRCHKIRGEGGEVGPELTGLGLRQGREYILESILFPNAKIAPGMETLLIGMKDGTSYAGLLKSETLEQLELLSPEDGALTLQKSKIGTREKGLSSMPEGMGSLLTKSELRNLVEFLATLR